MSHIFNKSQQTIQQQLMHNNHFITLIKWLMLFLSLWGKTDGLIPSVSVVNIRLDQSALIQTAENAADSGMRKAQCMLNVLLTSGFILMLRPLENFILQFRSPRFFFDSQSCPANVSHKGVIYSWSA